MQEQQRLDAEERDVERLLGGLKPVSLPHHLSAARVLIESQRRQGRYQLWVWRGVAAALGAGLVLSMTLRPQSKTIEKIVYVSPAAESSQTPLPPSMKVTPAQRLADADGSGGDDYLSLRDRVFVLGLEALPAPAPAPAPPLPPEPRPRFEPSGGQGNVWSFFELMSAGSGGRS
jgi:hypothetical protein